MQLKQLLDQSTAFRHVIDHLNLSSSLTRRYLYQLSWQTDSEALEQEFEQIARAIVLCQEEEKKEFVQNVLHKLMQVRDISLTVRALEKGVVLSDIELFEIKHFALFAGEIATLLEEEPLISLPDLKGVFALLDPDNSGIGTFYIYDSYSTVLAQLRKQMQHVPLQDQGELLGQCVTEEDKVRAYLTEQLLPFHTKLQAALEAIAYLDLLLAKASQALRMHFCRPIIGDKQTSYTQLFNPQVAQTLEARGKKYQPIDITLDSAPILITGMNMGGKTVLLKTLALAQYLFQFGFYVPASSAEIVLVEKVMVSIEDKQSDLNGLSSFAAEMRQIDAILKQMRQNRSLLVLIDEPARTTNPTEGCAIVEALLELLNEHQTCSLITTHYDHVSTPCRRLRVRGFSGVANYVDVKQLEYYIDYTLEPDRSQDVPHEALRIAKMLQVDEELIARAKKNIS